MITTPGALRCAVLLAIFSISGAVPLSGEDLPSLTEVSSPSTYSLYRLVLESPVRSVFPSNNRVYADVFVPVVRSTGRVPVVLVLPGLAEPSKWVENVFCRALTARGIAAILITLPYQFERRPHEWIPSGKLFLSYNPKVMLKNYEQAVQDVRAVIDWVLGQEQFPVSSVGVLGISLGSLVGLTAMGRDPRLEAGVFILGGGDLAGIVWNGALTRKAMPMLKKEGLTREHLEETWRPIDPLTRVANLAGRRLLLYNARWDRVIPKESVRALWDALPGARKRWIFGGHYTAIMHIVWIPRRTARFFREWFFEER